MSKCECKNCVHYNLCQEINNLKCRQDFIWYSAESGCPHYRDKSQLKATFKCTSENCPIGFNANWCTLYDCEHRTVPPTNFDKITSSVEALAKYLSSQCKCDDCDKDKHKCKKSCKQDIIAWLNEECKDE